MRISGNRGLSLRVWTVAEIDADKRKPWSVPEGSPYRRSLNYNQGNVRRLITLGTPHYGSPLGDVLDPNLSDDISCPSASGFISAPIVGVVDLWKGYDSAIRDLRPGSALLDKLNQGLGQEVPSFGVAGDVEGFALNVSSIKGQALYSLARILDCQGLISVASDGLVSVESASGNFSPSAVTVFDDIFHTQLPTSQRAVDEVLRVLRVPEGELSRYALRSRGKQSANSLPSYLVDRSRRPSVATRDPSFLGIAFDLFGVSAASAQEASGIRLSVDDPSPRPGGSVKFSAQVTGEATGPLILSDGGELTRIDDEPPYRWTLDLAPTASSERDFFVAGAVDDNAIRSNSVTVTVKPDLTQLREIGFEPARPINLFSGQTRALRLLGLFDDGLRRVLTQGAMETNYSERVVDGLQSSDGDSAVIEVSADGVLTAAEPGEAEVVATNNGNTTVKRVKVSPVAAEDADGDGLSNNDEADAGTDPFHMDTDRDGSSDNVEVGPDSGQPLSTGTDGRIDAMNPDVIAVQTENGIYVSVSSSAGTIQDVGSRTGEFLPQIPDDIATDPMALGIIEFEIADLMPGQNAEVTFTSSATIEPAGPYVGYGPVLPDGTEPKWFSANDVVESGYSGIVLRLSDNKVGDSNPRSGFIASTGAPSARQEKATGSGGGGGCTLAASASQRIDPILPCLALLSLLIVGFRRRNRGVGDVRS